MMVINFFLFIFSFKIYKIIYFCLKNFLIFIFQHGHLSTLQRCGGYGELARNKGSHPLHHEGLVLDGREKSTGWLQLAFLSLPMCRLRLCQRSLVFALQRGQLRFSNPVHRQHPQQRLRLSGSFGSCEDTFAIFKKLETSIQKGSFQHTLFQCHEKTRL